MKFALYYSLASFVFGQSLSNDDYVLLQKTIRDYVSINPNESVPKLIRTAFHDVQDYNPEGKNSASHGCLVEARFLNTPINSLVKNEIVSITKWVAEKIPATKFPFGDIFAMAGKVAAEWDYPCANIKFRYGRSACTENDQIDKNIPTEFLFNMTIATQFSTKLGLSPKELAVLIAGAHGTAVAKTTHWNFSFSKNTSGKEYITRNFNAENWKYEDAGWFRMKSDPEIGRFNVDMMFYPSTLQEIKKNNAVAGPPFPDLDAKEVESYLRQFVDKSEMYFFNEYAEAFAKMLEIGTDASQLKPFTPASNTRCSIINQNPTSDGSSGLGSNGGSNPDSSNVPNVTSDSHPLSHMTILCAIICVWGFF